MDQTYTAPDGTSIALSWLVGVSESAGRAILAIYNAPDAVAAAAATSKADSSPLTAADTAANDVIVAALAAATPAIPVMTEEAAAAPADARAAWALYWCVDPLDGTKEFLRRNGEFTVNIALMSRADPAAGSRATRPVAGVVHAPVLGRTYFAADGLGAWAAPAGGAPVSAGRVSAAAFGEADAGLVLVVSRSHMDARTEEFVARFASPETRSMGSSLKFMLVATGDAHVYPRLAPTMEWDTAASQIIVEEAGGEVLVHETSEPMRYNKEDLLNPFFLVYGARKK